MSEFRAQEMRKYLRHLCTQPLDQPVISWQAWWAVAVGVALSVAGCEEKSEDAALATSEPIPSASVSASASASTEAHEPETAPSASASALPAMSGDVGLAGLGLGEPPVIGSGKAFGGTGTASGLKYAAPFHRPPPRPKYGMPMPKDPL